MTTTVTRIRVEVTAEDIERGTPLTCDGCAVALAMSRALPGRSIEVQSRRARIVDADGEVAASIPFPMGVTSFIYRFDSKFLGASRADLEPFAFDLDVPVPDPTEGP